MDFNPYNTTYPTGRTRYGDRCPICGEPRGECLDAAPVPMPIPPLELGGDFERQAPAAALYTVTVNGYPTVLNLSETDAARYGPAAVPL